jgi:tRNA(Arg) A34 adenosine deaminase TadA
MITNRDRKYMDIAFTHAQSSERVSGARISAIMVYKNKIYSFGKNQKKSHPFQNDYRKNQHAILLHAETDCIKNALRNLSVDDLRKCTIYIARAKYLDNGKSMGIGMARPCKGCMRAIVEYGIKRVVYTTDEQELEVLS